MQARKNLNDSARAVRVAAATAVLAVAAVIAQNAIAQPHGRHQGGFDGGGMALMHPQRLESVLDSIGASADQRAQIKQIVQAARDDLKGEREAGRTLREQSRALFAQPTVDARAAETLRQQMVARHDQVSKRTLQAMLDVSRVLTPEQRKTLADRMAQRQAMLERHRAERQSLAPAAR